MFSSFFSKGQKAEKNTFVIPQYPSYAAIYEINLPVNIDEYFSGSLDSKLAIVKLFGTAPEALAYLLGRPTHGSYLVCLDLDMSLMQQLKDEKNGFGEHMVKAIRMSDYVMSTWERNPLPAEQVTVIENHHIKGAKGTRSSLTIKD